MHVHNWMCETKWKRVTLNFLRCKERNPVKENLLGKASWVFGAFRPFWTVFTGFTCTSGMATTAVVSHTSSSEAVHNTARIHKALEREKKKMKHIVWVYASLKKGPRRDDHHPYIYWLTAIWAKIWSWLILTTLGATWYHQASSLKSSDSLMCGGGRCLHAQCFGPCGTALSGCTVGVLLT